MFLGLLTRIIASNSKQEQEFYQGGKNYENGSKLETASTAIHKYI